MRQYLDGLKFIEDHGITVPDRTGTGRHRTFDMPNETYDLRQGFPLVTTREINPLALIDELLWFISGSTKVEDLRFKFFWQKWMLTEEQAKAWAMGQGAEDSEEYEAAMDHAKNLIGTIGPMYGHVWRKAPSNKSEFAKNPVRSVFDFPMDFLDRFQKEDNDIIGYENYWDSGAEIRDFVASNLARTDERGKQQVAQKLYDALQKKYWETYDQLNEMIIGIKTSPFSSRHRVTAMLPELTALESLTPQENILADRGCLTPCHTFYQVFAEPQPKDIHGNDQPDLLHMRLYMSSNDAPVGRVYNIAQYSILLAMIAQCTDKVAGKFTIMTGDGHIYSDQHEGVALQLTREPLPLSTLWLNPGIKDITQFTHDDIKILDYQSHPPIKYPVSV